MSDTAIQVQQLGKSYRITHSARSSYKTIQEDVLGLIKRPFQRSSGSSRRETFWALQDVSFEVKHGEVLGIIGQNGAGKSTLLKILSRITKPTTGSADIYGRVGSLLEVGTGFHPELTGRENIFLNGAILGMTRREIQRRFDEIVAFAEIEQFLDTPAKRYSSGMYMRLAFAVAAHLDPEILVVDEVLAVGDAEFQKKSLGKMSEVAKGGRTVLFVSHNMDAVLNLCQRAIVLERGKIMTNAPVLDSVQKYLSARAEQKKDAFTQVATGNRPIEVTRAEVKVYENAENSLASQYCEIEYVAHQTTGAVVAIKVKNNLGNTMFTSLDTDVDTELFTKEKGNYSIQFRLPDQILSAGVYDITISVADMKAERFQYLEDVLQFEVFHSRRINNSFPNREGVLLLSNSSMTRKLTN
jgi:lipopolysaccharide transport system ATP-binding protein